MRHGAQGAVPVAVAYTVLIYRARPEGPSGLGPRSTAHASLPSLVEASTGRTLRSHPHGLPRHRTPARSRST